LAVLVFIDESGDPGFKVDRGASPIFVAVTVIFEQDQHAAITQLAIEGSQARRIHKPEFKFSECGDRVRDLFFEAVRCCPFRVRGVLIRKEVIYSPRLKADRDRFYAHFVKSMMKYDSGLLANAKIISDGSGIVNFETTSIALCGSSLAKVSSRIFASKISAAIC
jgi:hypothetical protein